MGDFFCSMAKQLKVYLSGTTFLQSAAGELLAAHETVGAAGACDVRYEMRRGLYEWYSGDSGMCGERCNRKLRGRWTLRKGGVLLRRLQLKLLATVTGTSNIHDFSFV